MTFTKSEIEVYMMKVFSNTENIRKLASMKSLDNDDDERIREMSITEVEARRKWIKEMDQRIEKAYAVVRLLLKYYWVPSGLFIFVCAAPRSAECCALEKGCVG